MVKKGFCLIVAILICCNSILSQIADKKEEEIGVPYDGNPVIDANSQQYIQNRIQYLESITATSMQGKIFITFDIDSQGNTNNHTIRRGLVKTIDEEILKIVKCLKYAKPATIRGKPVSISYYMVIEFNSNNKQVPIKNE
jgi:hypothetical protein